MEKDLQEPSLAVHTISLALFRSRVLGNLALHIKVLKVFDVLYNNWNIACMMKLYDGVDFRPCHIEQSIKKHGIGKVTINPLQVVASNKILLSNMEFATSYYGTYTHPYEVIFVKTNRNIKLPPFY